ncbi:trehalose-6-phosphate synthase [Glycomyces sp. YM15]|uniref:alpha,alpha-trehalose-phosphate synthase (UDP-forming) n=1 Tax=Glycomyces sp. YM15 TaxID=2800446 RepID=UPI0019657F58|nr:trehalose-6-phosphate synthase [Glycomyces sp. YM15]
MSNASFIVVANRLPVDSVVDDEGNRTWRRSPGGLVTALEPVLQANRGTWIGWAGTAGEAPDAFESDGVTLMPVPLSENEVLRYYEGFSNASLWPLYHDAVEPRVFRRSWWKSYYEVNERFADVCAREAAPGAVVWVQDYQLQLVPGMLRERRPDLRIGFFLHIPFPPVELFMQLPHRMEILKGLLGADLVGFQRPLAAQNFLALTRHLLGYRPRGHYVTVDDRLVRADAFPISIDTAHNEEVANSERVRQRAKEIRAELGEPETIILGVDRLDYTKGIEQRLKAFHELLEDGRLQVPNAVMVQVATPSRERVEQYRSLRERVERQIGRINGEYGQVGLPAVHYLHQSFDRYELAALYQAADVMAVTPLRDGMNLVAKEYVASRIDNRGALVLSEFAGAAGDLRQAFLVNPHDLTDLKDGFVTAANAPLDDKMKRMRAMRRYLRKHDVNRWARSFLTALGVPERSAAYNPGSPPAEV